jgi:hypothetical protein
VELEVTAGFEALALSAVFGTKTDLAGDVVFTAEGLVVLDCAGDAVFGVGSLVGDPGPEPPSFFALLDDFESETGLVTDDKPVAFLPR